MYVFTILQTKEGKLKAFKLDTAADANGLMYVYQTKSDISKRNHGLLRSGIRDTHIRVYATSGSRCPKRSFNKYLEERNSIYESLFQKP